MGTVAGSLGPISQISLTARVPLLAAVLLYRKSALVISTNNKLHFLSWISGLTSLLSFHTLSAP